MKVRTNIGILKDLIDNALPIINQKAQILILHNFLIRAKNSRLEIVATDLDISIIAYKDVEVLEEGEILINAKKFAEIVKNFEDEDEIEIISDENLKFELIIGNSKFSLVGINSEEFPKVQYPEDINYIISVKGLALNFIIDYTLFAVSKDIGILTGINFEIHKDFIRMVGTDSHKLGLADYKDLIDIKKQDEDFPLKFVVPNKVVKHLSDTIEDDWDINIAFKDNFLIFNYENILLSTRLLEGTYPNYEAVIPEDNQNSAIIERKTFMNIIKRSLSTSESGQYKIIFKFDSTLEVYSYDTELGAESKQELSISYEGEPIEIAFNGNYLLDILKHIKTDDVEFKIGGSLSPTLIKPLPQSESENVILLLMPLRIKS